MNDRVLPFGAPRPARPSRPPLPQTIEIRARIHLSDVRGGIDTRTIAAALAAALGAGHRREVELEALEVDLVPDLPPRRPAPIGAVLAILAILLSTAGGVIAAMFGWAPL